MLFHCSCAEILLHNQKMPADGDITIRGILREHNRFSMPKGFWHYCFNEKGKLYGISLLNGFVVSGFVGFTRFMYYGNLRAIRHLSVPSSFFLTVYISGFIILKQQREEAAKRRKEGKGMVTVSQRVPMSPQDIKRLQASKELPSALTPDNLRQYGLKEQPDDVKDT